jgi:hypothetical protein
MLWASAVDAFDSFDPDIEGDAAPIFRSLGVGPAERRINWLFSSNRLLLGGDLLEYAVRSSALDEPITPTNFSIKATGDLGSAAVAAARIDADAVFVIRTGTRVFEDAVTGANIDHTSNNLCALVPEIGDPEIVRLAVQRQPDTRIHAVRSDGTVALCVFDKAEDVLGWCEIETDGEVEDAIVLPAQPGVQDDYVYYVVKRDIDGEEVRYLEKWAQAQNTRGGVGLAGDEVPFQAFTGFEVSRTDFSTTGGHAYFGYTADTESFYVIGRTSDDLYSHTDVPFPPSGTFIEASGEIGGGSSFVTHSGVQSKEGNYYCISGNDQSGAGVPIRVFSVATGTVVSLGVVFSGSSNCVLAAREGPPFEIVIGRAGFHDPRLYRPNLTTGAIGAAIWSISKNHTTDQSWTWSDDGNIWVTTASGDTLFQINVDQGTAATHAVPAGRGSGLGPAAYDSNSNKLYVVNSNQLTDIYYLDEWSGWNTTPTADSGTWTTVLTESVSDASGARYLYYDPEDDVLLMYWIETSLGSAAHVRRYTGEPKVLVDTVAMVSDTTPTAGVYGWEAVGISIFYKRGTAYIMASDPADATGTHLIKLTFDGADILEDADGNPLVPGGTTGRLHNLADSYINVDGPITTVTGLEHLEGEEVVAWGNGKDLGTDDDYAQTLTVVGGEVTLPEEAVAVTVGLPYIAQFKSSKLAVATQMELLFGHGKRISEISFVLADTHAKGIRFGPDFDNLDDRPLREGWADIDPDEITEAYDEDTIMFQSEWATDLRVCLQAQAPRPCTVMAVKLIVET